MVYSIRYPEDRGVKYEEFRFPGGEVQVRLLPSQLEEISKTTGIALTARIRTGEVMPVSLLISALSEVKATFSDINLALPYLPYARADRRFVKGDCEGLTAFMGALMGAPFISLATLDAHSEASRVWVNFNVSPLPLIKAAIDNLTGGYKDNLVILLPDEGAHRYDLSGLGYPVLQAGKHRDPATGKLSGFSVPPKEEFGGRKMVLIVDDICDGGGTFIGIADAMANHGVDLYLYVTHGIFSKGLDALASRFRKIYTTDSFYAELSSEIVHVFSADEVINAEIEKAA